MVLGYLYSQEYYTQRLLAEEMISKITNELDNEELVEEKRKRKELILQCIKYYFSL